MKKAFTLIELISVIIVLGIVSLISSMLVIKVIKSVKNNANKRSVDNYGKIVEIAMEEYQSRHLKYPDSIDQLEIEYTGNVIECEVRRINPDKTIYLSECKVNGKKVSDNTEDGYYHYGTLVLTNEEYVDKLGNNIELALKDYYKKNNKYPINYRLLDLPKLDKDVNCISDINPNGTVYLTKCTVDGEYVLDDTKEDGYYHYGESLTAVKYLLKKTNPITVTNYTDGDIHEMYTFEHEATDQTPELIDYRYIGSDPNNYVEFNNELWRIIGVFKVEDENGKWEERVKLSRDTAVLRSKEWDKNNVNEWVNSSAQLYLNDIEIVMDEYILSDKSHDMISSVKYYLGGSSLYAPGEDFYHFERGTVVYSGRNISWIGVVALMYPSDYIFTYSLGVDDICYNNPNNCKTNTGAVPSAGWQYRNYYHQRFLTHDNSGSSATYRVLSTGIIDKYDAVYPNRVTPVVYLKSNVKISSGDGTSDNPYKLAL